jgi:hypothetical protein
MACSLQQHGNSPYAFTSSPGPVTLTIVQPTTPAGAAVQFDPTDSEWEIQDQNNKDVDYKLTNNNQAVTFTAVKGTSYSLVLPFLCIPSSCFGLLQEDCAGSSLSLSLISVNNQVELSIAC